MNLTRVTSEMRRDVFNRVGIIVPDGTHSCSDHEISRESSINFLKKLPIVSETTAMSLAEMAHLVRGSESESTLDCVQRCEVLDGKLRELTGLSCAQFENSRMSLRSLKDSANRTVS